MTRKHVVRCPLLTLVGLIWLTLPLASTELEVAAHQAAVLKVAGQVHAQVGSRTWAQLNEGSMLHTGDRIKTGPDGFAAIILSDQTVLKLAENTELVLVDLRETEEANLIRRFQLSVGRVWSDVTPRERSGSVFEIEGPQATAAVKGTAFEVDAGEGQTEVRVWEGSVEASADGQKFLLGADRNRFQHDRFQMRSGRPQVMRLNRATPDDWQKWNLENRKAILRARRQGRLDRQAIQRFRGTLRQGPPAGSRRSVRKRPAGKKPLNRPRRQPGPEARIDSPSGTGSSRAFPESRAGLVGPDQNVSTASGAHSVRRPAVTGRRRR